MLSSEAVDVLIVGAGHAGVQTAIGLRRENFAGSILIIGDEHDLPYERPPLSKGYLSGGKTFDQILLRSADFYAARGVRLRLGARVDRIDPAEHRAHLGDGTTIAYRSMVWATGGRPRRLSCPGGDLPGVYAVRTRTDVDRLRSALPTVGETVIIGGGYIGLETAAVLRKLGKTVTVVEAQDRVLARVAGAPLSRFYEEEHRRRGVVFHLGAQVSRLEERGGRVAGVRLADGEFLPADAVLVGIGIVPEVGALEGTGARCSDGVEVDEFCRTSLADVFAVGDVARHQNKYSCTGSVRIESVQNASDQAATVARYLAGRPAAHDVVPWFWSTQFDLRLQTVGLSAGFEDMLVRGDPAERSFSVIYLRQGRVVALDCVNAARDYVQGKSLIVSRRMVDRLRLTDVTTPLKELAEESDTRAALSAAIDAPSPS